MRVSSTGITLSRFVLFLITVAMGYASGQTGSEAGGKIIGSNPSLQNPAEIFQHGQEALKNGKLEEAERDFQQVLAMDPRSGAAYANLGVVSIRRKQWAKAIEELEKAEKLMPNAPGVRLNIGLVYFRQNEFLKAIPEFESVVRDQPETLQARHLLGLCYFFNDQWAEAVKMLESLWTEESGNLLYLYVLSNAAYRAGRADLDQRATEQLLKVGNDSPEYHLFAGKYHLTRGENDEAIAEFESAAKANPRLAFVHFNLGLAYLGKQQYAEAREEFRKDIAIEPDEALNYEEIGEAYWMTQDDASAEKSYREALRKNPRLVNSRLGLAKIYLRQQRYAAALAEADAALRVDQERTDGHYLRGQALLHLGRKDEAKKEMVAAAGNTGQQPNRPVPSPELVQEQQ